MDIKGHTVHTVMIAQGAKIAEEYYFSILLDRANRSYLAMCSKEGGMEIEQLAVERPEALARIEVDPNVGIDDAKAQEIVDAAGFDDADKAAIADVLKKLWVVYRDEDATLVEVNPLVRTPDDQILALDGKVTLDANADFRQPGHEEFEDRDATDPLELKAKENDLNYVKLDGQVGIIGNGAGLVMSTLDVVAYAGENHGGVKPANFLDIGGGASAEVMAAGLAANLTLNPFASVTTVTTQIVQLLTGDQEFDSAKTLAAFALGLVLAMAGVVIGAASWPLGGSRSSCRRSRSTRPSRRSPRSASRSATRACCARCPAAWTPRSRPRWCSGRSAIS